VIGLIFLVLAVGWLLLSIFIALNLPKWLKVNTKRHEWLVTAGALVLLLVGPFLDEIIGMRQFNSLCNAARGGIVVSDNALKVMRARRNESSKTILSGYIINIEKYDVQFSDTDTGNVFLRHLDYSTKGGRLWGFLLMGGRHWCSVDTSTEFMNIAKHLSLKQKLEQGGDNERN
jgi:hypothetical protein